MDKSRMKKLFRSVAVCTLSATMLFSGSCGKPDDEKDAIAVIAKQDISFWKEVETGARDAGDELGYDIIYNYATSDNDYASQIEFINNAINDKVKAIVIAPNSSTNELNDAFEKAEAAGIKIININSRADYEGVLTCVSSSDSDGGAVAARHSADSILDAEDLRAIFSNSEKKATLDDVQTYGKGAIAILGHTASTAQPRIDGYKSEAIEQLIDRMGEDGVSFGTAGKQLDDSQKKAFFEPFFVECEQRCSTIDASKEQALKLLQSENGANIRTFFATNTNTTIGVCQAVDELGLTNKVFVVGFNSDEQEINYLKSRVLDGLVVQNPYSIGYVGVSYAKKAIDGQRVPSALDTGVTYVDSDNLNDDYIDLLLHPDTY